MDYVPPLNGKTEDPDRPYVDADPANNVEGSIPSGAALEQPMRELLALIEAAALVPDGGDLTQVKQAVTSLIGTAIATLSATINTALAEKVAKTGDAVTGLIDSTIAAGAGLRLTISDNTASLIQSLVFRRGDGSGTVAQFQTRGDAANGIDQLRLNFAGGQSYTFNTAGNLLLGADPSAALDAATKQYVDGRLVPTGTTILFNGTSAPAGFLKENGAAVSRTTYAALYAVIGTAHGVGDGATTFNLPESRGEFFRALDDGRGIDAGRALASASTTPRRSCDRSRASGCTAARPGPRHSPAPCRSRSASWSRRRRLPTMRSTVRRPNGRRTSCGTH